MSRNVYLDGNVIENLLRDIESALELADAPKQRPLSLTPDFVEVIAKARTVFTVSEIAEIAGVKDRQVHHWAAGEHTPNGAARDRVLQLFQIVSYLETHLDIERVKVWMWTPQSELGDAPVNCLKEGRGAEVLSVAKGLSMRDEAADASLVELARAGNTSAYEAIVRRYRGFVQRKASLYGSLGTSDEDDLIQEGLLGLYKAIRDFHSEDVEDFRTFAERCITRQLLRATRTSGSEQRPERWHPLPSLNASARDDADLHKAIADEEKEALEEAGPTPEEILDELIRDRLSEFQGRAVSLYLDGLSYAQIATELDCGDDAVAGTIHEVKRHLGRFLAERAEHHAGQNQAADHQARP